MGLLGCPFRWYAAHGLHDLTTKLRPRYGKRVFVIGKLLVLTKLWVSGRLK